MSIEETIARNRADEIAQAWAETLDTESGRLAVWSILERCHLFASTFTGDPLTGAHAEGERSIGLMILRDRVFPHDPRTFADMQAEHAALMDRLRTAAELEHGDDDGQ